MNTYQDIFSYIRSQENDYQNPIQLNDSWRWSMKDHIKTTVLYKNSQLMSVKDEFKPVKNITLPILRLQYRAEGFDVKDITIFVDDPQNYFKSLLVRKFHEKWARENGIDTVIDAMVESYIDFGGALLKQVNDVKPEVVPLQSIAFCDQTDILSGPIGIKHFFSPDQLLDMASKGWGDVKNGATATLEETIDLSRDEKRDTGAQQLAKTPGRYIEVYEVHGNFPKSFLTDGASDKEYSQQLHIVCFYQSKNSAKKGHITLYRAEEFKSPFKLILRDGVYGRALGLGGAEELFESQVWTNYGAQRLQNMLDAASVTILGVRGPTSSVVAQKNKVKDMDNLDLIDLEENQMAPVDTIPRSAGLFETYVAQWEAHGQKLGGATDALLGEAPSSGTPFALQNLITQQSQGIHDYRKGKLATFWDEVERDWIIPYLAKEIVKEQMFLAELDLDELQWVSQRIIENQINTFIKEKILNLELVDPQQIDQLKQQMQQEFQKRGNKHFIEILKGEMKGLSYQVRTNIAGKQKDLANRVEKLSNVFKTIISNPYILQSPPIAKLFNMIIEASGLDPIDLSGFNVPPMPARRMTESIDYKDLAPDAQQAMLKEAGIDVQPTQTPQLQTQPAK